jgi:DNA-binding transcriptional regulator YiaG
MDTKKVSGTELRDEREAAGLTQEAVADALGLSRQTIVTWESRARVVKPKADKYLRVVRDLASKAA